jgi:hypothetical protein
MFDKTAVLYVLETNSFSLEDLEWKHVCGENMKLLQLEHHSLIYPRQNIYQCKAYPDIKAPDLPDIIKAPDLPDIIKAPDLPDIKSPGLPDINLAPGVLKMKMKLLACSVTSVYMLIRPMLFGLHVGSRRACC